MGHGRVLAVAVPPQIDLALEGLVTESAGERLVAGVLAHVGDQIGRLAEGFAAHDALVRLFTCNITIAKEEQTKTLDGVMQWSLCAIERGELSLSGPSCHKRMRYKDAATRSP